MEDDKQSAMTQIEKLHQTDMRAAKTQDLNTLLSLWTDDCILLQPGQEPLIGKESIRKFMEREFKHSKDYEILHYEHHFEEVSVRGDWAWEWGTFIGSSCHKKSGEVFHQRARLFRILKQQPDGSWKCARSIWHELPKD
jgi:uncharacterized protein (TIGR02246 family)